MRVLRRTVVSIAVVLVLLTVAFLFYANLVMRGERDKAIDVWTDSDVQVTSTDHSIVLSPTGRPSGNGLVFIPGAKVDPYAYMYKLSGIVSQSGVTVVITKPTLNLAFFDQRPLSTFTEDAPDVVRWFVGGHSLGGVRACQLAGSPDAGPPTISGLVLFGSYCANDLSDTQLRVLSLSGSEDGLSTPAKIEATKDLLPAGTTFTVIEGADHASFGDYGFQPGDNPATKSSADVRDEITQALFALISAR